MLVWLMHMVMCSHHIEMGSERMKALVWFRYKKKTYTTVADMKDGKPVLPYKYKVLRTEQLENFRPLWCCTT